MKSLSLGGLILLMSLSANAAPGKAPRELLVDYTKQVREFMYGKGKSAKTTNQETAKNRIVEHLELPGARGKEILMSLSGEKADARMDALVTIIAAKKMSTEIAKKDAQEAASLNEAANATAKLIANHYLLGEKPSKELTADQLNLVREAILKAEVLPSRILTEFSRAERDAYTQILEKFDSLNQQVSQRSAEENFILAIMEVKKVDRTKALEVAKKLKECV